ncbi:MAG TPA: hypothetical protein VFA30_06840 [Gaiellaceae bacterium]|nr:hypothetical protein [Gaiellaceae bacterium]
MRYEDGETTLKALLRERGVDLGDPDPLATWTTFKEFAAMPAMPAEGVDPDGGDMVLFQWGVYDWYDGNGERFEIDFTRQFSILTRRGDYDHMEQLHCTFQYEPTEELRALGAGDEWIVGDLDAGFGNVESLPVFAVLRDRLGTPIEHRIEQERV